MIQPIFRHKAIDIIREIPTTGHQPLLILADNYEQYFIKSSKGHHPAFELISEILCAYLLQLWEIPTPEIALVNVGQKLLSNNTLSSHHKKHYFQLPCFASKLIRRAIDSNMLFDKPQELVYEQLYTPNTLLKIGLFDIWIENDDRKPSNHNLLLTPFQNKYRPLAIDHAYTFNTLSYDQLNPDFGVSVTFNESILHTDLAFYIYSKIQDKNLWATQMEIYFYESLKKCQDFFEEITVNIPEEYGFIEIYETKVQDFLFDKKRNQIVFNDFLSRFDL